MECIEFVGQDIDLHYLNSEKRKHRLGQSWPINIVDNYELIRAISSNFSPI